MQLVTRRRTAVALLLGGALTLGACGAAGGSHVVSQTPAVGATPSAPSAASTPSTSAPASSSATASGGSPVDSQTLNQVDAELGGLDATLNQANTDIDNPQGDS